jgi:GntR family transcriptional regulator
MNIDISQESTLPLYKQIFNQIKLNILKGDLRQGEILPSIRQLSKKLSLSVITVKNAYNELEHKGYIITRQGKGCYVSTIDLEKEFNNTKMSTEKKLKKIIFESRSMGLKKEDIKKIFDNLITNLPEKKITKETQIAS